MTGIANTLAVWRDALYHKQPPPVKLLVNTGDFDAYYEYLKENDPRGPMTTTGEGLAFKGIEIVDDDNVPSGKCIPVYRNSEGQEVIGSPWSA